MATLGKEYADREIIVRQGDAGNCMYVVQEGEVEAFGTETRSCTIRALGNAKVLTIDKKSFLSGIQEDPSLAFRIVKVMSQRIRDLTGRLAAYEMKR
jgi:CRP-like cAMP-binding protein